MKPPRSRYSCNEHFFDAINTEEKAYYLGFLAADGTILNSRGARNRIRLRVAAKDVCVLDGLKAALQSNHPIAHITHNGFPATMIQINSPTMVTGLAQHGVWPRKTFDLSWPVTLPDDMLRHYVRGFIDGDGSWYIDNSIQARRRTRGKELRFQLSCASPDFIYGLQAYFERTCGIGHSHVQPPNQRTRAYSFHCSGRKQMMAIADALYSGTTIYLMRKHEVVTEAIREFANDHALLCKRCGQPITEKSYRGRTGLPHRDRLYCSRACGSAIERERKKARQAASALHAHHFAPVACMMASRISISSSENRESTSSG